MTTDEKEDAAFELLRQATEAMTRLAAAMERIATAQETRNVLLERDLVEQHIIAGMKSGGGLP